MEETNEIKKLYHFFQGTIYLTILMEIILLIFISHSYLHPTVIVILTRIKDLFIYDNIFYSKCFTLLLILIVSIGTKPRKNTELDPHKQIMVPLFVGFVLFFGSSFFYIFNNASIVLYELTSFDLAYVGLSFFGGILIHVSFDNISKRIKSDLMKDKFNVENESFDQSTNLDQNEYSVNLPIKFYSKGRIQSGWMNIVNPFRSVLLIGTPGSGKTVSVIIPFIVQHLFKGFSALVYDFKYPDLSKIAYYHYLINKKRGVLSKHKFHVINLNNISKSRRINPLRADYIQTLADASETAEALIQSLRRSDKSTGADQFFSQSAINFLSSVIYFLSKYQKGKYSTFAHVLSFINRTYAEIFSVLFTELELHSILSPFKSAYEKKAFDQLEGQVGTLKINISRLATKETYWVFSGDDFDLKISDRDDPSILVLANDPDTQGINSACYSVVLNRLIKLVNKRGNLPTSIIIDEVPTIYIHKIENLIATARSNKVSTLMGLQELPQLKQQYGREAADTICSIAANVISGSARSKETLEWLEKLFGKVRQIRSGLSVDRTKTSVNINQYMDYLIPAGRIANLKAGEVVAQIALDAGKYDGKHSASVYNCKVEFDQAKFEKEAEAYAELPDFYNFGSEEKKEKMLKDNMLKINSQIDSIIQHCLNPHEA